MREYETVFITQPNISDTDRTRLNERVENLIKKHSGKLFYARSMGRRALAYPIMKQTKGIYTCLDYAAGGLCVREIEHDFSLDENVLRFLTVVKNESVDIEARAAEIVARGEDVQVPVEETDKPFEFVKSYTKRPEGERADEKTGEEE